MSDFKQLLTADAVAKTETECLLAFGSSFFSPAAADAAI